MSELIILAINSVIISEKEHRDRKEAEEVKKNFVWEISVIKSSLQLRSLTVGARNCNKHLWWLWSLDYNSKPVEEVHYSSYMCLNSHNSNLE